ncbi:hypothetical protein KEM56_002028 [Ascosphaera pollenicola]|nr:hypothetical protein KEM56_002028 [Ascosphaera pollenicola]
MRFFNVFSAFMITAAVAIPTPGPVAAPAPIAAPENAIREVDAAAAIRSFIEKAKTIDFKQIRDELEQRDIIKRDGTDGSDDIVQKVETLVKNVVGKFQGDVGNFKGIIDEVKNVTSGSGGLLSNGISVINNAAVLLGGDSAKIGNQLLTSKLVDDLGKQSTYDSLLPLLKNAKPLLDAKFINNVVGLINGVAPVMSAVGELIDFFEKLF